MHPGARTLLEMPEIPYTVRRSGRARRVRVNVRTLADQRSVDVEVVLPRHAPAQAAAAAMIELRPWIERRLGEAHEALAQIGARAGTVPYLGFPLELVPQRGRSRVHRQGNRLLVPAGDARPALERFYRRAARAEISARLDRATALVGSSYSDLAIRAQRSRWGSCSASGRMSFNWRLLLAPERVLDYVVWHEVCHLEVPDHSRRFWALVAARWPGYREDRKWLRDHGATLVL
jgi:predicted metal-dependent hydrolase